MAATELLVPLSTVTNGMTSMMGQWMSTHTLPNYVMDVVKPAYSGLHAQEYKTRNDTAPVTAGDIETGIAKHGFLEQGGRQAKRKATSNVFKHAATCTCTSSSTFSEHICHCLNSTPDNLMKHGLSSAIDPTAMTMAGMLEQSNFKALLNTIEHFTDAQVGAFWNWLVPVFEREPNAAISVIMTATSYFPIVASPISQHGMPVVARSKTASRRAYLEHYGISASIDVDLFTCEKGKIHWAQQILQISKGIALSQRYGAAVALANSGLPQPTQPGELPTRPTIDEFYNIRAATFASLQTASQNAWKTLVGKLDEQLGKQHAASGERVMVVTQDVPRVLINENSNNTREDTSGPRGPNMLEEEDLQVRKLWQVLTAVVPDFLLSPGNFRNPFRRYEEIGEYVTCFDDTPMGSAYSPNTRDRLVMTAKGNEVLRFTSAIRNLAIWNGNAPRDFGIVAGNNQTFPYHSGGRLPPTPGVAASIGDVLSYQADRHFDELLDFMRGVVKDVMALPGADAGAKIAAFGPTLPQPAAAAFPPAFAEVRAALTNDAILDAYMGIAFTKANMLKLHTSSIRVPFGVIVANPHKRYIVSDGARMIAGQVVMRLDREGDAAIITNQDRTHSIIAEKWHGTAVIESRNIAFARSIVINSRLNNGMNGESLQPIDITNAENYDPVNWKFGNGDAIYIPVPIWFRQTPENLFLPGHIKWHSAHFSSTGNDSLTNGYPSSDVISSIFNLRNVGLGGERIIPQAQGFEGQPSAPNLNCRMAAFYKSDKDGQFKYRVEGNGWWKAALTFCDDAAHVRMGKVPVQTGVVNEQLVSTGF
jgi:hypothetical protein